jgi:hypothetical protein
MGAARLSARSGAALGVAFALSAAAVLVPAVARAHAALVKSVPAARAVLNRPPAKIQLWFNERVEPRYSGLTLVDARGAAVDVGASEVPSDDPKSVTAVVKTLAPGRYVVKYRVLSTDGHVVQSEFPFTVR